MKAADWIDRLRAQREWGSDYRVAKELEVSHSTISRYRNKPESTMDDDTAVKVAGALHLEVEIVVLDQVAERTKSEPAKTAIERALKRLGGVVAGAVIAAGLVTPAPSSARAQTGDDSSQVCIMSTRTRRRRGVLRTMADALCALAPSPFAPA